MRCRGAVARVRGARPGSGAAALTPEAESRMLRSLLTHWALRSTIALAERAAAAPRDAGTSTTTTKGDAYVT